MDSVTDTLEDNLLFSAPYYDGIEVVDVHSLNIDIKRQVHKYGKMYREAEKIKVADQARTGDTDARKEICAAMMINAQNAAANIIYAHGRRSHYLEFEDLFQVAMSIVIEELDRALAAHRNPFPYLDKCMQSGLTRYRLFRMHAIVVPDNRKSGRVDQPYAMEDIALYEDIPDLSAQIGNLKYKLVEAIVKELTGRYRTVIEMRYGLNGNPVSTPSEINLAIAGKPCRNLYQPYEKQALAKLRKMMFENSNP